MRQKQFLRPLIHQALCFLRWKHLRLLTLLTQQLIRLILLIEGRSLLYDPLYAEICSGLSASTRRRVCS